MPVLRALLGLLAAQVSNRAFGEEVLTLLG